MKNGKDTQNDAFWRYLDENSKVVATWPTWLRGESRNDAQDEPEQREEPRKLAS
jgi:hypothetical protein